MNLIFCYSTTTTEYFRIGHIKYFPRSTNFQVRIKLSKGRKIKKIVLFLRYGLDYVL